MGEHYTKTAARAHEPMANILDKVPDEYKDYVAVQLGWVFNIAMRTNPRKPQHTVRLRAVEEAVRPFGVKVIMRQKKDPRFVKPINLISIFKDKAIVDESTDDGDDE